MITVLNLAVLRSLAAALLANALTDLLKGRDTAEILSWIQGRPAALPFWLACQCLEISPQATRERLQRVAANPSAYREPLRLVGHRTKGAGSEIWLHRATQSDKVHRRT